MSTDLRKARELFLHAVGKLPPEQWADYAAGACGGDVDLEQQLGALLQVHREAGSFLTAPVFGLGDTLDQPSLARVGTQIGPYKLLQIIGEGGMGVVYMAEQTVHKLVARAEDVTQRNYRAARGRPPGARTAHNSFFEAARRLDLALGQPCRPPNWIEQGQGPAWAHSE